MGVLKDTRWCEKRRISAALQADIRTRVGSRIGHRLEQAGYRIVLRCTIRLAPARIRGPD
ncbi:hypothetical protein ACU6VJ_03310 [Sphaerotilus sulfidivorans]|uniref:hypothetical protein n=1 Tax=Sphaerotilus sp. FB-3 TaxID=2913396 RepID=UPI001C81510D|nr:hypothetical protein [Sphaerotilus sp. FB-3]